MQTGTAPVENSMEFPQQLKMELPYDPAIPLLGLYPKNPETPIQKNLCTPMFIAAQFTIAKCWKQPKCLSVNEWIKKLWHIYTMEHYPAERKKELRSTSKTAFHVGRREARKLVPVRSEAFHQIPWRTTGLMHWLSESAGHHSYKEDKLRHRSLCGPHPQSF